MASRGEVWLTEFNPTMGREQSGRRPALIISADTFNAGRSELVVVLPITSTVRPLSLHVRVEPPEGGLRNSSVVLCEQIRSVSVDR